MHHDERSIKSLDFESDTGNHTNYDDYASEPVPAPKIRPTPPKKPLRLSLQRAQSLQVVNDTTLSATLDHFNLSTASNSIDKKRAIKRIHNKGELYPSQHNQIVVNRNTKYIEKYV
jgi:sulfur dioxygenase